MPKSTGLDNLPSFHRIRSMTPIVIKTGPNIKPQTKKKTTASSANMPKIIKIIPRIDLFITIKYSTNYQHKQSKN